MSQCYFFTLDMLPILSYLVPCKAPLNVDSNEKGALKIWYIIIIIISCDHPRAREKNPS